MKTGTQAHARAKPDTPANRGTAPVVTETQRQQAFVAFEGACVLLKGCEALGKIQEKAAHAVFERYAAVGRKLRAASNPAEILAAQGELLRFDMQAALRYWEDVGAATLEMQTELLNCGAHLVNTDALIESTSIVKTLPFRAPLQALLNYLPRANPWSTEQENGQATTRSD